MHRHSFISIDFNQFDVQILANVCGDENLNAALLNGRDIYNELAAIVSQSTGKELSR
jgi:DNA polymerase I-like protein with 3'-5' exonuclease and polymerase domains